MFHGTNAVSRPMFHGNRPTCNVIVMSWNGLIQLLGKSLTYYIGIRKEGKAASKHTRTNDNDERRTAADTVSMHIV
jgi:hypothetical protein